MGQNQSKRIETPANFEAVRQIIPAAKSVSDGIYRMMTERSYTAKSVVNAVQAHGGTIHAGHVQFIRAETGLQKAFEERKRDKKKLCSCCGLKPRKGRFLCSDCFHSHSDSPGQQLSIRTAGRSPAP